MQKALGIKRQTPTAVTSNKGPVPTKATKRKRKHNRRGRTTKKMQNKRRSRRSRSPKPLWTKAWKRETQKQRAESQELTRHCHSCTGVGEGMRGARREQTLSAAPGVHPIPWNLTQPNGARPGGISLHHFMGSNEIGYITNLGLSEDVEVEYPRKIPRFDTPFSLWLLKLQFWVDVCSFLDTK